MKKNLPKRPGWKFEALEKLLPLVESACAGMSVDYGHRSKIVFGDSKKQTAYAELWTKRKDFTDVVLYVPTNTITVGAIAKFGSDQLVIPRTERKDAVSIRFTTGTEVTAAFGTWLTNTLKGFNAAKKK